MRATRRRTRHTDLLASPEAVRSICQELRERLPQLVPGSERQLIKLLDAVRHIERRPATDTKRGRPSRWSREELLSVAAHLRSILERETSGRISLSSFIGQYLRILDFPPDITAPLSKGDINLFEAAQLARLTPERMGCSAREATAIRSDLLRSHLAMQASQNRLRERVREMLGEVGEVSTTSMVEVVHKVDELLEIDPSDKRHIFYEEMKRLFYAMREIKPEDIDDQTLDEFMAAADQLSNAVYAFEMRRRQREKKVQKIAF